MSILRRFKDIMASNMNALLDRVEDPEKMIDQYLRNLQRDLSQVKSETATVMAQEKRAKRDLEECQSDMEKMTNYAVKALEVDNESDARKFLERKAILADNEIQLQQSLELAEANSIQMRQIHDKLMQDIGELNARRTMLKGKAALAKAKDRMNDIRSSVDGAKTSLSDFDRLEEKINQSLDEAEAMAELNRRPEDDIEELAAKYTSEKESVVNHELAALKAQLKQKEE